MTTPKAATRPKRGGARPNSGRPALGNTEQILLRVSPDLLARIDAAAVVAEVTVSDYLRGVIDRATRRAKR